MRLLLWGASGQVGREISARIGPSTVLEEPPENADISDAAVTASVTEQFSPDCVINCAAYTAVDKAEEERDRCFRVNADGAQHVAEAAQRAGARVVFVSTDYVFPGTARVPIPETADVDPINTYGASKAEGERRTLDLCHGEALVVRTSSVHGIYGHNFVHTMLRLFQEREELQVVEDQIMSPTWAGWLAEILLECAGRDESGAVHASGDGQVSWFEFASAILAEAELEPEKQRVRRIHPVSTMQYPTPARRPPYSVLDCTRLEAMLGRKRLSWREGLQNHLADYRRQSKSE